MWYKFFQATSPSEPLVCRALRFIIIDFDSQFLKGVSHLLCAHLFLRATAEKEIIYFLIELVRIRKHSVKTSLHIQTENRPAETSDIRKPY